METLMQIFSPIIGFISHCFDCVVINGYISILSRPERVVYFFETFSKNPVLLACLLLPAHLTWGKSKPEPEEVDPVAGPEPEVIV